MLPPFRHRWAPVLAALIEEWGQAPTDLDAVKSAIAVLKCLSTFLRAACNPTVETALLNPLGLCLEGCLETLDAYYPFYENMVINDTDSDAPVEEGMDGGPIGLLVEVRVVPQDGLIQSS